MTRTRAHGGAVLAALLAAHGVRHVFGVPGGQTMALYDAMLDPGVAPGLRHILVRDERTAAYAADGYARVTGRVGVCDATVGPGAAKLPSGLGEALGASVPVLALVSELPAALAAHRYRGAASQALDQAAMLGPVTKWHATVPDIAAMPDLVRRAFREAATGRPGPVALLLPQDVLDAAADPGQSAAMAEQTAAVAVPAADRFGAFPAFRPQPDPGDVAAAAALLASAGRPFLLAGGGVLHSRAGPAVTALARRLSAAVATTLSGTEPDRAPWRARLAQLTAAWRQARDLERSSDAIPIAPQRVVAELERVLGPDDILVCDASLASGWAGVYLEQRTAPRRVLSPRGLAGLGYAVPAAIGVAAGLPGRVVVLAGDGALGYAVGELATIAQGRLPVVIVVLNNRSVAWIRWYRRITFGPRGQRVTQPQRLAPALRTAMSADRPSLVDVVTDTWQTPIAAHRRAVEQGAAAEYGG